MNESLYVVMPAYNESEALPAVIEQWRPIVERNPRNRLVIVDDGSTDATPDLLEEYGKTHRQLVTISKRNAGHGAAVRSGYRYAISGVSGDVPDYVFQTDSDAQTKAEEFAGFWERRHLHDAIIGQRVQRGDGFARSVVTRTLRAVISAVTHVRLPDANTPFRLMRTSALAQALAAVPERHNLVNAEISIALARLGKNIHFKPITFGARQTGTNSIDLRDIAAIGLRSLSDLRELDAVLP